MLKRRDARRSLSDLLLVGAIGGLLLGSGCSGMQPEPDIEGGDVQSPTHEQDALREDDERGEEGGRR